MVLTGIFLLALPGYLVYYIYSTFLNDKVPFLEVHVKYYFHISAFACCPSSDWYSVNRF